MNYNNNIINYNIVLPIYLCVKAHGNNISMICYSSESSRVIYNRLQCYLMLFIMSFFYIFHDRLPTILRYCHKFGEVSNKTTTTCNIFMYIICLWTMVDVTLPLGSSWCYVLNTFGEFHDEFTALQRAIALLGKIYLKTVNPNWEN